MRVRKERADCTYALRTRPPLSGRDFPAEAARLRLLLRLLRSCGRGALRAGAGAAACPEHRSPRLQPSVPDCMPNTPFHASAVLHTVRGDRVAPRVVPDPRELGRLTVTVLDMTAVGTFCGASCVGDPRIGLRVDTCTCRYLTAAFHPCGTLDTQVWQHSTDPIVRYEPRGQTGTPGSPRADFR